MTMVERMARAICLVENPHAMSPRAWEAYVDAALAVLKAMHDDPSPAMATAAYAAWDRFGEDATLGPNELLAIWRASIDAFIAEASPVSPAKEGSPT